MQCPSCGATVETGSQKCDHCGRNVGVAARPKAPQPDKYRIEDDGYRLAITWSWFTPVVFFLLVFAIGWNSFLFVWYGMALFMPGPMKFIFLLFPLIHVAVGLGLIYTVITMFLNSTSVVVEQGLLTIRHFPVYFPGNMTIETADIDQIYVTETTHQGKNGTQTTANLQLRTRDNRLIPLLKRLTDTSEAVFLEQKLESHLKIRDERVAGEISHA